MKSKRTWSVAGLCLVVMALLVWTVNSATVTAQVTGSKDKQGREVTMTGRVVDLSCFMADTYASADHAKCTADCINAGVPAGLETDKELIILGKGMMGPAKVLAPLAFEQVEVRGKLFEKMGVKYLDISSIQKTAQKKP